MSNYAIHKNPAYSFHELTTTNTNTRVNYSYMMNYMRGMRSYPKEYRRAKQLFDELDKIMVPACKKAITNYLGRARYNYYEALEIVEQLMEDSGIREYCSTSCKGDCCSSCEERGKNGCKLKVKNLLCSIHTCRIVRGAFTEEESEIIKEVYDTIENIQKSVLGFRYYFDVSKWDERKEDLIRMYSPHSLYRVIQEMGYNPSSKMFPASIAKLQTIDTRSAKKWLQKEKKLNQTRR